ncbi:hypothetical protein SAMN05216474_0089 [Lishizhenia tianjinensis]|uniref:Ankyrin repeat-containing protein n=1 Tax=Lishizhenia tianjinensis TaxID=477690 RepID=A0A1I6XC44_9FLAO|nr:hypothetical protein SAMN05216474_0089 [Lishizhenia tianjinensis]
MSFKKFIDFCTEGNLLEAKKLNITPTDKVISDALKNASYNGHLEVVKYLMEFNYNYTGIGQALINARAKKHFDIVKFLEKMKGFIS